MKRVIYVVPFSVLPPDTGTKIRVYQTVRHLSHRFEVHVLIADYQSGQNSMTWSDIHCKEITTLPEKLFTLSILYKQEFGSEEKQQKPRLS